ncbi:MAG: hypothetical protein Q8P47_00200 [Candidatus Beckwithbacteria bacterium]|nr:hypothetical protein [Candidatus Beckwithbacteria bacterium]
MATLTETAMSVRKLIKFSLLGVAIFLTFKFGLFVYNTYIRVVNPPPPPPPTVAFGKLPKMAFPEKLHPELTLRLETPTGGTPSLGDRAEVLLMPQIRPSFSALDESKITAGKLNFRNQPSEITERRYKWESSEFLPSTLEMDIVSGSFILKRNWQADPTILSNKRLPGKEETELEVKNWLKQIGLGNDELDLGKIEITYLTFSSGQYTKAVSLSEADFVQADLFRPDINDLPILTEEPSKGVVRVIFSGSDEAEKRIVQAEYNYFPVNTEETASYPIKTASQAWRELQTRQGYIASIGNNPENVISIRRIYLGYFDNTTPQGFLMPIIVFEGDNGFFGYAEAITSEWLELPPASGGLNTPN